MSHYSFEYSVHSNPLYKQNAFHAKLALSDDTNFSLTIIWILVDCKVMS